jgi:tetratricopeptide (TPR) repeat protein
MMQTRINLKAAVILAVSLPVLGIATHWLHGFQVQRNAQFLLDQAKELEEEGKLKEAAGYLRQYIGMVPDEAGPTARFALLRSRLAQTPRQKIDAYFTLEQALRLKPGNIDVRKKAAALAVQLGLLKEALEHFKHLEGLLANPLPRNDAGSNGLAERIQLLRDKARCYAGLGNTKEAKETYLRAIAAVPAAAKERPLQQDFIDLYREVAYYLRLKLKQHNAADDVMNKLVGGNPQSTPARMARAYYRRDFREWGQAAEDVGFVRDRLKAHNSEVLLLAADLAGHRGEPDQVRHNLLEGLKLHPQDPQFPLALARLDMQEGRRKEALGYLRSNLKLLPANANVLQGFAETLIELDALSEARQVIKRLAREGSTPTGLYLKARIRMKEGAWGDARDMLDQALARLRPGAAFAGDLHFWLAQCYGRMDNFERQLRHYQQAVNSAPLLWRARQGLASSLAAQGNLSGAIAEYERLVQDKPEEVGADLVHLLVRATLARPDGERDWARLDRFLNDLDQLPSSRKKGLDIPLLRAEVLINSGRLAAARGLLKSECARDGKRAQPWLALVRLALREKQFDGIPALLERGEASAGPHAEWALARAAYQIRTAGTKVHAELRKLAADIEKYPAAERGTLLLGLGQAFAVVNDMTAAQDLWRRYVAQEPGDVDVRLFLFELAVQNGHESKARQLLSEIRRATGRGALTAYGEAALLVLQARQRRKTNFAEARRLLKEAAADRPSWSRVPLLEGQIFELEGNEAKALESYQLALRQGDKRLPVVRRVAQLLYKAKRYAEAEDLVRGLPAEALRSEPGLGQLGAELSLLTRPSEGEGRKAAERRALDLARQTAGKSKDYRDHLWLGQIAAAAGENAGAEKAFREARRLAKKAPAAWAALILFLAKQDSAQAKRELAQAEKALPPKDRGLPLAPCYEALGKTDVAQTLYRAALAATPEDPVVNQLVAAFYQRTRQPAQAEPLLRKLFAAGNKANKDTQAWARRTLALLLAGRGSFPAFKEALKLLDRNKNDDRETFEDSLVRARILATQPSRRPDAIELLRSQKAPLPADSKFLLARLYEEDGNWPLALGQLTALLKERPDEPRFLAHAVRCTLAQQRIEEAKDYVERLGRVRRNSFETAELTARVYHAAGNAQEAVQTLRAYAEQKDARKDAAALVLEQLGQFREAKELYQAHADTSSERGAPLALAGYLSRRGLARAALDICEKAWQTCPAETVALVSVSVLRTGRGDAVQQRRVAKWLADADRQHPRSVSLLLMQADLEMYRDRHAAATALYRQVLKREPQNIVALNNLAFLLGLSKGDTRLALQLIDKGMKAAGPTADLLDTQATIYLAEGKAGPARKAVRAAIAQTPSAMAYFHLAQAEWLAKNTAAARLAFAKATELGLKADDLHPLERPTLRKLKRDLNE